jgi:hypothetical protein
MTSKTTASLIQAQAWGFLCGLPEATEALLLAVEKPRSTRNFAQISWTGKGISVSMNLGLHQVTLPFF